MKGLWSCYLRMAFQDGDNFCKAFAGALVNMSYHSWLRHSWHDKLTCAPAKALQTLSPSWKTTVKKVIYENQLISKLHLQAFLPAKRAATHRLTALVREKTREKPEISTPTLLRPTMTRITIFHPKNRGFFGLLVPLKTFEIHKTFCPKY